MKKQYAIRETPKGFRLCEVSISDSLSGKRKYSRNTELVYKKKEFAIKKAHSFYNSLYAGWKDTELEFIGVIKLNEYCGELI